VLLRPILDRPISGLLALFVLVFSAPSALRAQATPTPAAPAAPHTILFFGDSLTAGYGLDGGAEEAYPALIQQKLRAAGLNYTVVNAGLSGDTTAGGLHRIDWLLRRPIDILFLELGGNDGLRGLPVDEAQRNLQAIIDKTRARDPDVRIIIAGMQMPANFGADYVTRFNALYPALAQANPGATLLPFLLDGVGGIEQLNQNDQIHPTAEGHRKIADVVWRVLEPLCRARP
jgi:acyl-CoA thioesterase-1